MIGVPHADFGEAVVAVVVTKQGCHVEDSNIIELSKQTLANYKVPKAVVVEEVLPRNSMGKVQKNVLRERYKDLLR